jgi:hypothetical protein
MKATCGKNPGSPVNDSRLLQVIFKQLQVEMGWGGFISS